jgi:hypothetical protein
MIAASAPPPAASTASAANCADPANTITDITIGAIGPMIGRATIPNEMPSSSDASANGTPALAPDATGPR